MRASRPIEGRRFGVIGQLELRHSGAKKEDDSQMFAHGRQPGSIDRKIERPRSCLDKVVERIAGRLAAGAFGSRWLSRPWLC